MSFHRNGYLSWYVPRARRVDGAINLHSSGVRGLTKDDIDVASGDPWTAVHRFEAALARWLGVDAEEVIFTPGGTGGTLLALLALVGSRDHVVVECPVYEPMLRQAQRLCRVDRLIRRSDSGWCLPLVDAEKLINADTRLVMITEPHNPSGCYAPSQQVLELAELAKRRRAILLVNEVYRGFGGRPSYHGVADNIVVVSSFSKVFGAYSARVGWLSGPGRIARRLRDAHRNMGMGSSPGAEVGLAVVSRADELLRRASEVARRGQPVVEAWVTRTPGLSWCPPQGPGFGCVALPAGTDDVALAERLHEERGVLTVPGKMFEAPGSLRISWLQSGERLEEGLDIIGEEVAKRS